MHNVQMFFGCFEFLKRTLDITILVQSLLTKKHLTVVRCFSFFADDGRALEKFLTYFRFLVEKWSFGWNNTDELAQRCCVSN